MRRKAKILFVPAIRGGMIVIGILVFCAMVGYTVGRFVEVITVQHVYSVSTPVTYFHQRAKHESEDEYQGTIAADQATINYLVSVFNDESAKLKEYGTFSRKYNAQIAYQTFSNNVNVEENSNSRELLFIGRSSDSELASNLSKSYAEDSVRVIQKISNTASINVELESQITKYDIQSNQKFGMAFMYIGLRGVFEEKTRVFHINGRFGKENA